MNKEVRDAIAGAVRDALPEVPIYDASADPNESLIEFTLARIAEGEASGDRPDMASTYKSWRLAIDRHRVHQPGYRGCSLCVEYIRAIASLYATHPDFQAEWAPHGLCTVCGVALYEGPSLDLPPGEIGGAVTDDLWLFCSADRSHQQEPRA